jgi:hypothetical protein
METLAPNSPNNATRRPTVEQMLVDIDFVMSNRGNRAKLHLCPAFGYLAGVSPSDSTGDAQAKVWNLLVNAIAAIQGHDLKLIGWKSRFYSAEALQEAVKWLLNIVQSNRGLNKRRETAATSCLGVPRNADTWRKKEDYFFKEVFIPCLIAVGTGPDVGTSDSEESVD